MTESTIKVSGNRLIDKVVRQSLEEIQFAREHKRPRIQSWQLVDRLYYRSKPKVEPNRSSLIIPKMAGFVSTLMSKVDDPPQIDFRRGEDADKKKADRLNALFRIDRKPANMNFDIKDRLGKKNAAKYGRAIYAFHAQSDGGYQAILEVVDPFDFLVDPAAGGIDIEQAEYLGRGNIIKTKYDLQEGAKSKFYLESEVEKLLGKEGKGEQAKVSDPSGGTDEEQMNSTRFLVMNVGAKVRMNAGSFKFFEWGTTYKGKRYYLLLNEEHGIAVRMERQKKLFPSTTPINPEGAWNYWTWAADTESAEFWSLGPAENVAETFMGQIVIINQVLDNNERKNRPTRGFDASLVDDPNLLRWRPDGLAPFKKGVDFSKAVKDFEVPNLADPLAVYNVLENITERESGITADAKGDSDEDVLGIYEGNIQQIADRLGLLNQSYANAYDRFARLYYYGVRDHLNRKQAIQMIGPNGVEMETITKADIVPKMGEFDIYIASSTAERNQDIAEKKIKMDFLDKNRENTLVNPKFRTESEARIAGFNDEEIWQMFNNDQYGDANSVSEADHDIQRILQGEVIKPNRRADITYTERIYVFLQDKAESLDERDEYQLALYLRSVMPIMAKNMARKKIRAMGQAGELMAGGGEPGGGEPAVDEFGQPIDQPLELAEEDIPV